MHIFLNSNTNYNLINYASKLIALHTQLKIMFPFSHVKNKWVHKMVSIECYFSLGDDMFPVLFVSKLLSRIAKLVLAGGKY